MHELEYRESWSSRNYMNYPLSTLKTSKFPIDTVLSQGCKNEGDCKTCWKWLSRGWLLFFSLAFLSFFISTYRISQSRPRWVCQTGSQRKYSEAARSESDLLSGCCIKYELICHLSKILSEITRFGCCFI